MSSTAANIYAVGVLLFTSLCLEVTSRPRQELISECVCWSLILVCGQAYFYFRSKPLRSPNTPGINPVAFGATLLCLICTFQRMTWSLAPLLPLALMIIEREGASLPVYKHPEEIDTTTSKLNWKNILLCLYAAITTFALFRDDPFRGFHLKLCWIFTQIILYWGLSNRISQLNGIRFDDMIEVWHTATELAQWMTLMTIPLTILWWNNVPSIAHVGITVLLKASRWIAILVLAHESRLSLIAWAMVFAVCTKALGVYSNEWQSVFILFGALVALHRVWIVFPTSSLGTYLILAFSLLPFWALGMRTNFARTPKPDVYMFQLSSTGPHHPIYELHEAAKARFEETQERQSRSLSGAVTEYRRRYRRAPPPGFSQWYEFVIENKVQWIDEYDFMTKSLDPFWEMPPHVLREYVDQVSSLPGEARFNTLEIKNHQLSLSNGNLHQHSEVQRLLEPVLNLLPDVKAVLNEPDEPRVLVPYSELHGEFNHYESTNAHTQPVYFGRQEWQIIWDSVTLPCSPESPARAAVLDSKEESFMPPFISNLTKSQDICSMPATAGALHGFLSSPSTFSYTQRLVPIMSTSKISTFQDIIMPSSAYFQGSFAGYDESKDVPWEQKKDAVYWRGSNTGGHWTQGSWRMGHRQRFVNFTNSPGAEIRLLKETTEGKWMAYKSKMSEQQEKFNAKFTGFIQCDDEDCKGQEDYFHKADRDKNEVANQYKILYNVDGNSFSGRYYRFLKSRCLVFQQELFKEWHDDRLIPWLHFVPIGLSMEELPETTRYLLDDPEGKVIAASIASDSHDWSRKVLREVDATAAYYRVFLEYARLLDDDRDALS